MSHILIKRMLQQQMAQGGGFSVTVIHFTAKTHKYILYVSYIALSQKDHTITHVPTLIKEVRLEN